MAAAAGGFGVVFGQPDHLRVMLEHKGANSFSSAVSCCTASSCNVSWMFTQAAANTSVGTAFVYGDGEFPAWADSG